MAPLIVIAGPTGSGKTGLALDLAERYNGEIICADSRTIYKGMDIGTAKPSIEEQTRVPHHLLDIVEPGTRYTAADFQADAYEAIKTIRSRGKVPFLIGGTGLYIDAVVREYTWPESFHDTALDDLPIDTLHTMLKNQHIALPQNPLNKRHLLNALMRNGKTGTARESPRENTYVVAIATEKNELQARIRCRVELMFANGVLEETKGLAERYGWDSEAMTSNIYPITKRVLVNEISQPEAVERAVTRDLQLAKRQRTWLRRHDYVQWMSLADAQVYLETILK